VNLDCQLFPDFAHKISALDVLVSINVV